MIDLFDYYRAEGFTIGKVVCNECGLVELLILAKENAPATPDGVGMNCDRCGHLTNWSFKPENDFLAK